MNVTIYPNKLSGTVTVPYSKSHSHRLLIAAYLAGDIEAVSLADPSAEGTLTTLSEDIAATKEALLALEKDAPVIDCRESGSTLRFMLPITMALKESASFTGAGKLPQRPLSPLWEQMEEHGCVMKHGEGPLIAECSGRISGGDWFLPGDVSSQYITGLLYALPLTKEGGIIHLTTPLESAGYVDLTLKVLRDFGIIIEESGDPVRTYIIPGSQKYKVPKAATAEGADKITPERDWSAAAFWLAANMKGSRISCPGLDIESAQGDKKIVELVCDDALTEVDASQIPDLVPILSVLMALTPGTHRITHAERLRIKESDRLAAMAENISAVGGIIEETDDGLKIEGGTLKGGTVDGMNDHRIVMSMAIAAANAEGPITIKGAQAITKSYPAFFEDFKRAGGIVKEEAE